MALTEEIEDFRDDPFSGTSSMSRRGGTGTSSGIFLLTDTNGELLEDDKSTPKKVSSSSSSSSSSSKPMIHNKFGELFCAVALIGIFLVAMTMVDTPTTTTTTTSTPAGQVHEKKNPAVEALTAHSPYSLVSFSSLPSNVSSTVSVCPGPENRCAPLDGDKKYNVIRIPKCASVSLLTEVHNIWSKHVKSFEQTPRYSFEAFKRAKYFFSSVKSPRHHVWSLFTECKYDVWFIRHREKGTFPGRGKKADGDLKDFETWLDYFVEAHPVGGNMTGNHTAIDYDYQVNKTQLKDYRCYHPSNFIARYFSVHYQEAHHVTAGDHKAEPVMEPGMDVFEPPVEAWNETYWKLDVVFVAELFLESKCLFYYRSLLANSTGVDNTHLQEFLDTSCRCQSNGNETTTETKAAVVHVTHHKEGHRPSMRDGVPASVLAKIEALTRVDVQLYKMALVEKLKQLVWLESPSQLGRRIVCTKKLEQLDYELEYLNFGSRISELYYHLKSL